MNGERHKKKKPDAARAPQYPACAGGPLYPIFFFMSDARIQISVVIPTYNRADLLPKAIQSALDQTFRDLELIIVDDGSTDRTEDVVRGYRDPRIRYVKHEQNRGLNPARNTGVRNARGEFVAFLDSDDEWMPDKLAAQLEVFRSAAPDDLGVVYCGLELYFPSGACRIIMPRKRGWVLEHQLTSNLVQGGSNALVRRKAFEQAGLFDEADALWGGWDDIEMWIRVAQNWRFDFVPRPLFRMYKHEESRSLVISKDKPERLIEALEYVLARHGELYDRHPAAKARMLRNIGTHQVSRGDMRAARRRFIQSIRTRPGQARNYANLLISLFGARIYKAVSRRRRGF